MESLPRRALAEGIGTFALVLIGPGAAMVDAYSNGAIGHAGVALAFGFVVAAMIYTLGHLSGAHINPAVTLGFWSVGRFRSRDVAPYVVAQCAGAIAASFAMRWVLGPVGRMGATLPAIGTARSFAVEWMLSFILMLVIIAVATDERVAPGFAGIAVGLTVGFEAMMGGPLTGASMNPARSLGPAVAGGRMGRALDLLGGVGDGDAGGRARVRMAAACRKRPPGRCGDSPRRRRSRRGNLSSATCLRGEKLIALPETEPLREAML